jgi:hypothetical protein
MQHGKRWALWVGVVVCVGVLAVGMGASAATGALAQTGQADQKDKLRCSLSTLKGTYLFAADGVQIAGNDRLSFAVAGIEVYDGKGKLNGVVTLSVNGTIVRQSASASYTINKDCTGTSTSDTGEHFDLFIAPDGSQFTFIQTDEGSVLAGFEGQATAKRVDN